MAKSGWWDGLPAREICSFQLFVAELSMPFDVFHAAVEAAHGRGVFTHEFGLNYDGLVAEFLGERQAPTFDEIAAMIPEDKRLILEG